MEILKSFSVCELIDKHIKKLMFYEHASFLVLHMYITRKIEYLHRARDG